MKCPFAHVSNFKGEPIVAEVGAGELSALQQVKVYAESLGLWVSLDFRCPMCCSSRWNTDMDGRYCRGSENGRKCDFRFTGDEYFTILTVS